MPTQIAGQSNKPKLVTQFDVRNLVSIIGEPCQPPPQPEIDPSRHYGCSVDDIIEANPGRTVPQTEHVADLIELLNTWDAATGLLVSRNTETVGQTTLKLPV